MLQSKHAEYQHSNDLNDVEKSEQQAIVKQENFPT